MEWRDKLALKSRRQADYAWTVLARVLSWSKDRGKITVNPCERGGRIYSGSRSENVWSAEQEAAFLKSAPAHLHLPLLLALWTGQRQGDLLRLPWSAYNGIQIKLRQSKTGARVVIPVGTPLKAALDVLRAPVRCLVMGRGGEGEQQGGGGGGGGGGWWGGGVCVGGGGGARFGRGWRRIDILWRVGVFFFFFFVVWMEGRGLGFDWGFESVFWIALAFLQCRYIRGGEAWLVVAGVCSRDSRFLSGRWAQGFNPASAATSAAVISPRSIPHRSFIGAALHFNHYGITSPTVKQCAAIVGVCVPYVAAAIAVSDDAEARGAVLAGELNLLDAAKRSAARESLVDHIRRSSPAELAAAAKEAGVDLIWDSMLQPNL